MQNVPENPRIYHILHWDRLPFIIKEGYLLSDAKMNGRPNTGTIVGMNKIKQRRLNELKLTCYPDLYVGQCVPFYFCPRSVMLYIISKGNHLELSYQCGQKPIIHLEADLHETTNWAKNNDKRYAFTLSNAGSKHFEDRNNFSQLKKIDWLAVASRDWQSRHEAKQAEFLIEENFPWQLIKRIGVYSSEVEHQVNQILSNKTHKPLTTVVSDWHY